MRPTVSTVIATYNHAPYLPVAVDSALGQTLADVEVIVIDDGSTDDTPAIMRRYHTNPRVQYHRVSNRGPAAARNTGIRLARAPLVAFLDSDDAWVATKLEQQVRLLAGDSTLGLVYARRLHVDAGGQRLERAEAPHYRGQVLPHLFLNNFICLSSALVRSDALQRVGLFDERITQASSEDYDLWLRLAREYRFDYVDEPLVLYRHLKKPDARRSETRLRVALEVMQRFLHEERGTDCLDPHLVRRAWAETYANLGWYVRQRSRWAALGYYCKALAAAWQYTPAWKGLASTLLPEAAWGWVRRRGVSPHKPEAQAKDAAGPSLALQACAKTRSGGTL